MISLSILFFFKCTLSHTLHHLQVFNQRSGKLVDSIARLNLKDPQVCMTKRCPWLSFILVPKASHEFKSPVIIMFLSLSLSPLSLSLSSLSLSLSLSLPFPLPIFPLFSCLSPSPSLSPSPLSFSIYPLPPSFLSPLPHPLTNRA